MEMRRMSMPEGMTPPDFFLGMRWPGLPESRLPDKERKLTDDGYVISGNEELQTAVGLYCSDQAAADAIYGDISTWNTGQVTSMASLFYSHCSTRSTFNADISNWDGKCGAESASSYFITS